MSDTTGTLLIILFVGLAVAVVVGLFAAYEQAAEVREGDMVHDEGAGPNSLGRAN